MVRLSLPGVGDALLVKDPGLVRALAREPGLDRDYVARGGLLNRLLLRHLRRVLQIDGQPLPTVAPRGLARPTNAQAALEARLDELVAHGLDGPEIDALTDYVRGAGPERNAGPLAQQAIGRLFSPSYAADAASWSDAEGLDGAARLSSLRGILWALTGRFAPARKRLASKVGGDPSGLHATGIAVHNLSEAFIRMRRLYRDQRGLTPRSAAWAVGNALAAPDKVLRQPVAELDLECGRLSPETLVILKLEAANAALPGADIVFMQGAWSRCPAHRWAPALMAAVWRRACLEEAASSAALSADRARTPAAAPRSAPAASAAQATKVDSLSLGATRAAAVKARERYQSVLALLLILEAAAALVLAAVPIHVARAMGDAAGWPWLRPLGVAMLVMTLLLSIGWRDPSRAKVINLLGIFGRPVLAVVLALAGGALLWAGAVELVAALVLARRYYRYFAAEVMSRP